MDNLVSNVFSAVETLNAEPNIPLMLVLIDAISDKDYGLDNAKFIALTLCSVLNREQESWATDYLEKHAVITL